MKNFAFKKIPIILVLSFVFTSVFSLFTYNAFAYTGYSGYVWVNSSSADRYVYVRPDSTSMQIGSAWTEWVTVFWKEGSYYYIEYNVSGYGGKKKGYIKETAMNNLASGIPQSNPNPQWTSKCMGGTYTVYNCANTSSYQVGSIWNYETITVMGEDGNYYYIQYSVTGGYKRGYVPKNYIYLSYYVLSNINLIQNASIDFAGDSDTFMFTPSTDGLYVVETFGSIDTYLTFTTASNNVYYDDDSGDGLNSAYGFMGTSGSTVKINIRHYSSSGTGGYTIQVRRQRSEIYTFDYGNGDINTTPDAAIPSSYLSSWMKYDNYNNQNQGIAHLNSADATTFTRLNSEVFFFSGHGGENGGAVVLNTEWLWDNALGNMRNTKLALWSACYSAVAPTGHTSIAQASVNNGARSSIGWTDTIWPGSAKTFTDKFFEYAGGTVSQAAADASSFILWPFDNAKKYVVFGDGSTQIYLGQVNYKMSMINNYSEMYQQFNADIKKYKFVSFDIANGGKRYYKTINNILTNDFYDVYDNVKITRSINSISDDELEKISKQKLAEIEYSPKASISKGNIIFNKIVKTEKHTVYYKNNEGVTPIQIIYTDYSNDQGIAFQDVTCINLTDNSIIDYNKINSIQ